MQKDIRSAVLQTQVGKVVVQGGYQEVDEVVVQ